MRVLFQQPVCPEYRRPFFTGLAGMCDLTVVAGDRSVEGTALHSMQARPGWFRPCRVTLGPMGLHHLKLPADVLSLPGCDVVVTNFNPRHTASVRLYRAARQQAVPVIWWGHVWSPTSNKRNLGIRRRLMNSAQGVIVYTEREARMAKSIGVSKPVLSMNNACLSAAEMAARAASLTSRPRTDRFLFLGRLTGKSRYEMVPELARRIGNRAQFRIVGATAEQKRRLDSEALANLEVLEAVSDPDLKRQLLDDADYFLYPGGVGLSVLEALSAGLPVITHADRRLHSPEHAYLRKRANAAFYDGSLDDLQRLVTAILEGRVVFPDRSVIAAGVSELTTDAMASRVYGFLESRVRECRPCGS